MLNCSLLNTNSYTAQKKEVVINKDKLQYCLDVAKHYLATSKGFSSKDKAQRLIAVNVIQKLLNGSIFQQDSCLPYLNQAELNALEQFIPLHSKIQLCKALAKNLLNTQYQIIDTIQTNYYQPLAVVLQKRFAAIRKIKQQLAPEFSMEASVENLTAQSTQAREFIVNLFFNSSNKLKNKTKVKIETTMLYTGYACTNSIVASNWSFCINCYLYGVKQALSDELKIDLSTLTITSFQELTLYLNQLVKQEFIDSRRQSRLLLLCRQILKAQGIDDDRAKEKLFFNNHGYQGEQQHFSHDLYIVANKKQFFNYVKKRLQYLFEKKSTQIMILDDIWLFNEFLNNPQYNQEYRVKVQDMINEFAKNFLQKAMLTSDGASWHQYSFETMKFFLHCVSNQTLQLACVKGVLLQLCYLGDKAQQSGYLAEQYELWVYQLSVAARMLKNEKGSDIPTLLVALFGKDKLAEFKELLCQDSLIKSNSLFYNPLLENVLVAFNLNNMLVKHRLFKLELLVNHLKQLNLFTDQAIIDELSLAIDLFIRDVPKAELSVLINDNADAIAKLVASWPHDSIAHIAKIKPADHLLNALGLQLDEHCESNAIATVFNHNYKDTVFVNDNLTTLFLTSCQDNALLADYLLTAIDIKLEQCRNNQGNLASFTALMTSINACKKPQVIELLQIEIMQRYKSTFLKAVCWRAEIDIMLSSIAGLEDLLKHYRCKWFEQLLTGDTAMASSYSLADIDDFGDYFGEDNAIHIFQSIYRAILTVMSQQQVNQLQCLGIDSLPQNLKELFANDKTIEFLESFIGLCDDTSLESQCAELIDWYNTDNQVQQKRHSLKIDIKKNISWQNLHDYCCSLETQLTDIKNELIDSDSNEKLTLFLTTLDELANFLKELNTQAIMAKKGNRQLYQQIDKGIDRTASLSSFESLCDNYAHLLEINKKLKFINSQQYDMAMAYASVEGNDCKNLYENYLHQYFIFIINIFMESFDESERFFNKLNVADLPGCKGLLEIFDKKIKTKIFTEHSLVYDACWDMVNTVLKKNSSPISRVKAVFQKKTSIKEKAIQLSTFIINSRQQLAVDYQHVIEMIIANNTINDMLSFIPNYIDSIKQYVRDSSRVHILNSNSVIEKINQLESAVKSRLNHFKINQRMELKYYIPLVNILSVLRSDGVVNSIDFDYKSLKNAVVNHFSTSAIYGVKLQLSMLKTFFNKHSGDSDYDRQMINFLTVLNNLFGSDSGDSQSSQLFEQSSQKLPLYSLINNKADIICRSYEGCDFSSSEGWIEQRLSLLSHPQSLQEYVATSMSNSDKWRLLLLTEFTESINSFLPSLDDSAINLLLNKLSKSIPATAAKKAVSLLQSIFQTYANTGAHDVVQYQNLLDLIRQSLAVQQTLFDRLKQVTVGVAGYFQYISTNALSEKIALIADDKDILSYLTMADEQLATKNYHIEYLLQSARKALNESTLYMPQHNLSKYLNVFAVFADDYSLKQLIAREKSLSLSIGLVRIRDLIKTQSILAAIGVTIKYDVQGVLVWMDFKVADVVKNYSYLTISQQQRLLLSLNDINKCCPLQQQSIANLIAYFNRQDTETLNQLTCMDFVNQLFNQIAALLETKSEIDTSYWHSAQYKQAIEHLINLFNQADSIAIKNQFSQLITKVCFHAIKHPVVIAQIEKIAQDINYVEQDFIDICDLSDMINHFGVTCQNILKFHSFDQAYQLIECYQKELVALDTDLANHLNDIAHVLRQFECCIRECYYRDTGQLNLNYQPSTDIAKVLVAMILIAEQAKYPRNPVIQGKLLGVIHSLSQHKLAESKHHTDLYIEIFNYVMSYAQLLDETVQAMIFKSPISCDKQNGPKRLLTKQDFLDHMDFQPVTSHPLLVNCGL